MTTKLKERIISLSRKEKVKILIITYLVIVLVLCLISYNVYYIRPIILLFIFVGMYPIILFNDMIDIVKKYDVEIIQKSRLMYLILSDKHRVLRYIIWTILLPIILTLSSHVQINLIIVVIILLGFVFLTGFSNIISNYFKKKLLKSQRNALL